eukprot:3694090-Prymnesium_polylepis.1
MDAFMLRILTAAGVMMVNTGKSEVSTFLLMMLSGHMMHICRCYRSEYGEIGGEHFSIDDAEQAYEAHLHYQHQ